MNTEPVDLKAKFVHITSKIKMFVPICATPLKPGFNRNSTHIPIDSITLNGRFEPLIRPTSQYSLNYSAAAFGSGVLPQSQSLAQYRHPNTINMNMHMNMNMNNCNSHYPMSSSTVGSPEMMSMSMAGVGVGGCENSGAGANMSGGGVGGNGDGVGVADVPGGALAGRNVPFEMLQYRKPAMLVSIADCIFATSLLVFHGLTLMVQEIPVDHEENNWLLPKVPMTPGMLTITGYMEVIAWIAILSVNAIQLLVGLGLFNSCDKKREALKAFEACRLWIKTCVFIVVILFTKLCILYFMYRMDMMAVGTIIFTVLETIFHAVGFVIVLKFFGEIKENNPMISAIYSTPDENSSPKRNNAVADAVWF